MKRQSLFSIFGQYSITSRRDKIERLSHTTNRNTLSYSKNYITNELSYNESFLLTPNDHSIATAGELHKEKHDHDFSHHTSNMSDRLELFATSPKSEVNTSTSIFSCSSDVQDSARLSNIQKNGVLFFTKRSRQPYSNSKSIVTRCKQFIYHLFQRKNNQRYTLLSAYIRQQRRGIVRTKKSFLPSGN